MHRDIGHRAAREEWRTIPRAGNWHNVVRTMSSRDHLVELIERLPERELPAAERFLEFLCADPVSRALALAPDDDEPESAVERQAVALARGEFERGERGTPIGQLKEELDL